MSEKYIDNLLIALKKDYSRDETVIAFAKNNELLRELVKRKNQEIAELKNGDCEIIRSRRENRLERMVRAYELHTKINRSEILNPRFMNKFKK